MSGTRAGFLEKNLSGQSAYFSFVPTPLPPSPALEIDEELTSLLIQAHKVLAALDEKAKNIPSMDHFVSMYVQKEALLSSQIEGTQATLEDLFDPSIDANVNADVSDVVNYTKAMNYATDRLNVLPLCNRLLLETHQVLLSGVRGKEKNPGEYRRSQNWIGGAGSTIRTARYIPPNVERMHAALSDLEKYMNAEDNLDPLIRAALIHYQFETIHPFLDGNGRIGRLLIVLYLLEKHVIQTPSLYLSAYLKANRIEYYDRMSAVRKSGDYEQWVKFFIRGIMISGKDALDTAESLLLLHEKHLRILNDACYTTRTYQTMQKVFDYLQKHPMSEIKSTAKDLNMAFSTTAIAFNRLLDLGILRLYKQQKRNKIYIYDEYLALLSENTQPDTTMENQILGKESMVALREQAAQNGLTDMSLTEINQEIQAVRSHSPNPETLAAMKEAEQIAKDPSVPSYATARAALETALSDDE